MTTKKESHLHKYARPPIPHSQKTHKTAISFLDMQKLVSFYYQTKDNYQVNGSFGMLHYYFKQKKPQNIQQIDFGIQYIESEQLEDTIREDLWGHQDKMVESNQSQQNFTDQEDEELQLEEQENKSQKSATFGTHCESNEYYINQSSKNEKQNNQCLENSNIVNINNFSRQDNLEKTAFFRKMQINLNQIKQNNTTNHKRSSTTNMYFNVGAKTQNANNVNQNHSNVSKKYQLLEKIKKEKEKKKDQWNRYISIDKQYLKRYLK